MQGQQVYPVGLFLLPRWPGAVEIYLHAYSLSKIFENYFQILRRPSARQEDRFFSSLPLSARSFPKKNPRSAACLEEIVLTKPPSAI
jgi:hypothetical protein